MLKGSKKYHYYDDNNNKIIKNFHTPPTDPKWIPGIGKTKPRTIEHCQKISQAHKNKPKSTEHKQKMSEAKKGKPKSQEHIENMRTAHNIRIAKIKELQQKYKITYKSAIKLLKEIQ